MVTLNSTAYDGPMDCAYRIVREESSNPQMFINSSVSTFAFGGIRQLYRGFWLHFMSNAMVCSISALSGMDSDDDVYYF